MLLLNKRETENEKSRVKHGFWNTIRHPLNILTKFRRLLKKDVTNVNISDYKFRS